MSAFKKLREANEARQKEWDPTNQISLLYRATELGGEAGEAQNAVKKIERERLCLPGSRATLGKVADELADVIIAADLIAMDLGIDLEAAIERKFNATSEERGFSTRLNFGKAEKPAFLNLTDEKRRVLIEIHRGGGRHVLLREPHLLIGQLISSGYIQTVYQMHAGGYSATLTQEGKRVVAAILAEMEGADAEKERA